MKYLNRQVENLPANLGTSYKLAPCGGISLGNIGTALGGSFILFTPAVIVNLDQFNYTRFIEEK